MNPDLIVHYEDGTSEERWANDLVKARDTNFEGWLCGIGLESIEIKSDGTIYRGTCKQGGPIGHISQDFEVPTDFIVCGITKCDCVADLKSSRFANQAVKDRIEP